MLVGGHVFGNNNTSIMPWDEVVLFVETYENFLGGNIYNKPDGIAIKNSWQPDPEM